MPPESFWVYSMLPLQQRAQAEIESAEECAQQSAAARDIEPSSSPGALSLSCAATDKMSNAELGNGISERHWWPLVGGPTNPGSYGKLERAAHVVRDQQGQTRRPLCIEESPQPDSPHVAKRKVPLFHAEALHNLSLIHI